MKIGLSEGWVVLAEARLVEEIGRQGILMQWVIVVGGGGGRW